MTMTEQETSVKAYQDYLPRVYQDPKKPFVGQFLKVFEALLSGGPEPIEGWSGKGLEQVIDTLGDYFVPEKTPTEFLDWLAGWVGLVLRGEWSEEARRELIQEIVSIYPLRGTKHGVERLVKIYAEASVTITDSAEPLEVGKSRVGVDTVIGGLPPHFFTVSIAFSEPDAQKLSEKARAVRALLDLEKPAHTYYALTFRGPTFQVGIENRARLGKDTLI